MKALVIDDNADIRLLLERVLMMAGFEVESASGGREGLQMLASGIAPEVVLLDVQMPVMDGWSTLVGIRNGPASEVPVVMCTVKGSADNVLRGWELGCDAYVSKPFDVRELMRTVLEVVGRDAFERIRTRDDAISETRRLIAMGG